MRIHLFLWIIIRSSVPTPKTIHPLQDKETLTCSNITSDNEGRSWQELNAPVSAITISKNISLFTSSTRHVFEIF